MFCIFSLHCFCYPVHVNKNLFISSTGTNDLDPNQKEMSDDATRIEGIVTYLKKGVIDAKKTDETSESDDEFPSSSGSSSDYSQTSEDIVPFDPEEWLVPDLNSGRSRQPHLLEFLHLLLGKSHYASYASYKDRSQGVFLIHKPKEVALLWEKVKPRHSKKTMTYDKFARGIRWYYQKGIMIKTNIRYTFQFGANSIELDENGNPINAPEEY